VGVPLLIGAAVLPPRASWLRCKKFNGLALRRFAACPPRFALRDMAPLRSASLRHVANPVTLCAIRSSVGS
jgi:hypothetical protein